VRADALARRFVRTHDMKVKEEIPSHHLDTMAKKPWPLAWLKRHTGWAILGHTRVSLMSEVSMPVAF
jgi:hypothetical protein